MRRSLRILLTIALFGSGLLAAHTVSAAPQDCLPVVGCVTTTAPSLPLPTVTVPTLPTSGTTTTATGGGQGGDTAPASTSTSDQTALDPAAQPESALSAKASVRFRGRGVSRRLEITLRLSKPARVSARLARGTRTLARRQVAAPAGTSVVVVRIGRATKPGTARLALVYATSSGETARASYRVRVSR